MSRQDHWQRVYQEKSPNAVSWYRDHLDTSLEILGRLSLPSSAHILDAGAGASTFVDDVLQLGFSQVTVVDIAEAALAKSRERLGEHANRITWLAGDITTLILPAGNVDFWHDRAVFHFLTDTSDRAAYIRQLHHCIAPKGHVLLSTFHLDGPAKCSGLEVQRYSSEMLADVLGKDFCLEHSGLESHFTPWESEQRFVHALFRRATVEA